MAYGYGIPGGYDGGSIGDGFQQTRFSRRDDYRPSANAECEIYPHAAPKMSVSDYVKEAAARCWFLPQYNWQNAANPVHVPQILSADPWRPRLAKWPQGYSPGATGSTDYFAQCWRFNHKGEGKGFWERLSPPPAPAGLVLCLVVSGVTWRFVEQNCYSTSLIARPEGIVNNESHEAFLMKQAGKLLADVKAWLEAR